MRSSQNSNSKNISKNQISNKEKSISSLNLKPHQRFYFQNLEGQKSFNPFIELKGSLNIKSPFPEYCKEEIKPIHLNVKKLPDSKRTLIPDLNHDEMDVFRSKSNIKTNNIHNYRSSEILFTEQEPYIRKRKFYLKSTPIDVISSINERKYSDVKYTKKFNEMKKQRDSTQVFSLPGGIKRDDNEISDDDHRYRLMKMKEIKATFQSRIEDIYKSNVPLTPERKDKIGSFKDLSKTPQRHIRRDHLEKSYGEMKFHPKTSLLSGLEKRQNNTSYLTVSEKEKFSYKKIHLDAYEPTDKEKCLIYIGKKKITPKIDPFKSQISLV